jgi:predicted ferric reductase
MSLTPSIATPPARAVQRRVGPLPIPFAYRGITARDIGLVVAGTGALVAAMWLRHGGIATTLADPLGGIGQLAALGGTFAALIGVLFASRAPLLDQVLGSDRLRRLHGWLGFTAVWAIGIHAILSTLAWAGGSLSSLLPTLAEMIATVPGMLGAVVGLALFVAIGITSVRAVRCRASYETFHGIHLYVYLALAFGYLHQVAVGSDFVGDPLAQAFWAGLYLAAFVPLIVHRVVWPLYTTLRFRPRVAAIVPEAEGVYSMVVDGRDLDRLAVRSGQFFVVRALTVRDWIHGHPFSISAAPNGRTLRFTIKAFGEGTRDLARLAPGTPLLLEGPYGAMHGARRTGRKLLFIAGGIGIAPIRALAEGLPFAPGDADLVYRSPSARETALAAEVEALARHRGIRTHWLVGRRGEPHIGADPLGPEALARLVPDVADRDVYLCGPHALMERTRSSLLALGVPPGRINLELFR